MDTKLIFVMIGVITTVFGRSKAITCYSCSSDSQSKCLDPFDSDGVLTCQGETCFKRVATETGVVVRHCTTSAVKVEGDVCVDLTEITDDEDEEGIGCICKSDYCNDGQLLKPTLFNVVIVVAMASVTAITWMNQV